VCLLADRSVYDRIGCSLRYLFVGLIDAGFVPIVIGPHPGETMLAGPVESIEYSQAQWPLRPLAIWALVDKIRERLDELRLESAPIIHALSVGLAAEAQRVARALNADAIVSLDGLGDMDRLRSLADYSEIRSVAFSSELLMASFQRAKPYDVECELIRYGLPADARPAAFRELARSPAIVFMGALDHDSRVGELVEAFRSVRDVHSDALLFIIGSGPAETSIRRQIERLQIEDAVMFTGRLATSDVALAGADVFCIPVAERTASAIPIQALAIGLTVVAAAGSVHDCLVADETAWLFPEGDVYALAQQLRRALDDRAGAIAVATRGQARARTYHSVVRMVEGFARLYEKQLVRRKTIRFEQPG